VHLTRIKWKSVEYDFRVTPVRSAAEYPHLSQPKAMTFLETTFSNSVMLKFSLNVYPSTTLDFFLTILISIALIPFISSVNCLSL